MTTDPLPAISRAVAKGQSHTKAMGCPAANPVRARPFLSLLAALDRPLARPYLSPPSFACAPNRQSRTRRRSSGAFHNHRRATCGPAATGASSGRKPAKSIDDERVRNHLCDVVSGSVEETLNAMLEPEAERLCNAGRYDDLAKVRGILTLGGFRLASLLQRPA